MITPRLPKPLLHVSYRRVSYYMFALPVGSLILCTILGWYLHFDEVTATHCKVPNFMPSISALIGTPPECYLWRGAIALFSSPRIFDAFLYYNFFTYCAASSRLWFKLMNIALFALHVFQYMFLLILTYVGSKENHAVHRNAFALFIITSMGHMLVFVLLFGVGKSPLIDKDKRSLRLRVIFVIIHFVSFFLSMVAYWWHNKTCGPYIYSIFGILEYIVILSNIGYHSVQIYSFQDDYYISIAHPSRLKHT